MISYTLYGLEDDLEALQDAPHGALGICFSEPMFPLYFLLQFPQRHLVFRSRPREAREKRRR